MNSLIQNILLISIMCTVVIFVMLLMRKMLLKHTSAWWRSAIWMLILLRMCIPLTAETPIGILDGDMNTSNSQDALLYEYSTSTNEVLPSYDAATTEDQNDFINNSSSSNETTLSFINIVGIIYCIGLAASLLLLIVKAISQQKYISNLEPCHHKKINNQLNTLQMQMGIKKNVSVLINNKGSMPMVYGLINPKIVLPKKSANRDSLELHLILSHELMHIKQLDILKLWISEIAVCMNWFNPIVYFIKNIINQDIELACDEKVLKQTHKSNHYEYSRIIAEYSTMHQFSPLILSSGINSIGSKGIKTRLNLIKQHSKPSLKLPGILIAAIAIIVLTACTTMNITNVVPSSFDWRDKGVVTAPQNQGEYASGSIFAAVSLMESYIAIHTNELVNLSEQHFINNSDDYSSDKGIAPAAVLDFLCEQGAVPENELPYTGIKEDYTNIEISYTLPSWQSYGLGEDTPEERIAAVKRHLIAYGPVITPITFYSDLHDYEVGVYEWDEVSEADYGHWLTIVGYQDDSTIDSGGYWIAKESWGTDWGEDGYIRIAYNDECGIDDYSIYYADKPAE